MNGNRGVVVEPSSPGRLVLREVPEPTPAPSEALIHVAAVSLNRGEVRRAMNAEAGWRPGWDLAGVVERAAADGSGPKEGARVVGMLPSGAWSERVAVPTQALAPLPPDVSFAQAATLPVAGLTALHALMKGGLLVEQPVLVTGTTGGVGDFALQLARLSGARAVAHVRRPDQEALVRELGAEAVVVGESLPDEQPFGPYHLILESVGGQTLSTALNQLGAGGICVSFGASGGAQAMLDLTRFYPIGAATLYGFILFHELRTVEPAGPGLARLAGLIAQGRLKPRISVEAPWTEVAGVAQQLIERRYPGKAVLHLKSS
ncbi:MAG TPA: zinc-binding dehydrogenase [Chthonomonadaceae bacterium]|nr:zinc-binding dehydrogenase [Chthonomonadaceae bacterium]